MLNFKLKLNENVFLKGEELKSTRDGFGIGIVEAAEKNNNVVALCGDLTESTKLSDFAKKFPKRYINVGIAEQNMAGIAAGLALAGKVPFMTSYAVFSPGRNWEQIRQAIATANANVKIASTHSGFSASYDGPSAQALEDIALMRVIPNITIISPIDYEEAIKATKAAAETKGPVYLRFSKGETSLITTPNTPFQIGEAYILSEGDDVSIITTGPITYEVLDAKRYLKTKYKIEAEIVSCPTIKPLDEKTILNSAKKTKKVVVVEEHQIAGGLGGAICELLSKEYPTKVLRLGAEDAFGESGSYAEILSKRGLKGHTIAEKVAGFVKNKK